MSAQDIFRQQRIAAERQSLRLAPWQFTPSQVHGRSCPYAADVYGLRSWRKATAQCAEILEADPTYFQRPPKG